MRKFCVAFFSVLLFLNTQAQKNDNSLALQLVSKNSEAIGLNKEDLNNLIVSSSYHNSTSATHMVYLLQSYKGLPVYNQMLVLAFKNEKLISNAGYLLRDMDKKTNGQPATASLSAADAVKSAFAEVNLPAPASLFAPGSTENGRKYNFGKTGAVREDILAELMWVPVENGKETTVKLAWQVQVVPATKSDYWSIRMDAGTGKFISKDNYTVYEQLPGNIPGLHQSTSPPPSAVAIPPAALKTSSLTAFGNVTNANSPSLVGTVNYTVIPYPAESPIHPGGTAAIRTNPWTLAGGNAVSLGWHNDGTLDYTTSRGNNVHAHEDVAANNNNNGIMAVSTTSPDPLNFNFTPNYTAVPTTPLFQQFALTNLFYWNNINHDMSYKYGFDEPAGNFQNNNQGRGGAGNDYVQADGQDGLALNNANMSTPPDGGKPRMQMFLWSAIPSFVVNSPSTIAGSYTAVEGAMSTANLLANVGPVTGQVVYYNDNAGGTTHEACAAPVNVITGKIALINRGTCSFAIKVKNAQNAGAIAVIMVNNVPGAPITMGGTDNTIVIPAVMISDVDGAIIAAQLANNVNVTLAAGVNIDGDIDNGIISHEFFHGVSNRLTGGPATTSCLGNAEQGGEGWSDYNALMLTTDWSTALITDGVNKPRAMGTYVFGQPITGPGIRNYKYCTDITVNPLTYANVGTGTIGTEVHNIGEVWCMALWEMTWGIIQTDGINTNLFNNTGAGGNSVAFKLMMEGLKLQPCSPGFIDARNAILQADINLYGGAHYCTIWTAFAKRGMGYGALQGSAFSATDQTAAFNLPPAPNITGQPASSSVCVGANTSFSVTATVTTPTIYKWEVSTDGGATYTTVTNTGVYTGATTATLTLTNVTTALNTYKYRCTIIGGCPSATSNVATLTVSTSAPVIGTQPASTSACTGTNTTFTVAATGGTLTYQWQESINSGTSWSNISNTGVYSGATTATLTLTGVTAGMNNNQYRSIVTGGCNGTTVTNSNAGTLTVNASVPIAVTSQPATSVVCAGSNASFTIAANGVGVTYNWQVSTDGGVTWTNLSPAVTTTTLTLTGVTTAMNNNQYRCQVTGTTTCSPGSINSNGGLLTVNTAPAFTTQPASAVICTASNISFTGATTGAAVGYQWQVSTSGCTGTFSNVTNGGVYTGATTATLTITGATTTMTGYAYRLVATGACTPAATSNCVTLTVTAPSTIATQPASTAACVNSTATFTGAGNGASQVYQWQTSTNAGVTWTNLTNAAPYAGVTTGTLTVTPVTLAMNGSIYRVLVSNTTCPAQAISNIVTLTANALPTVQAAASLTSVCTGTSSVLTATGANTYVWTPTGTGTGATVTVTPTVTTTYTVTGTTTATGCATTTSVTVIATPKPTLSLTAAPYLRLLPGLTTTITATANSATTTNFVYSWIYTGSGIPTAFAGNTHQVTLSGLGTYTVTAADASNLACVSLPATVTISDSASSRLFIFPSPNDGKFTVAYYNQNQGGTGTKQIVTVYSSKGERVYKNEFVVTQAYQLLSIDLRKYAAGVYYVVLADANGKKIKTGEVIVR